MTELSSTFEDMERRLRAALRADRAARPPAAPRSSRRSTTIVELAADELESWELEAIKDPRNWPRAAIGPATAIVVGSGAAVGLVVLRTQRKRHKRRAAVQGRRATSPRARCATPRARR